MGTPTIQAKRDRNYRRGRTGHRCSACDHFVYNAKGPGEHRCMLIGDGGRGFRILEHYICDDYDNTERLARLTGPMRWSDRGMP